MQGPFLGVYMTKHYVRLAAPSIQHWGRDKKKKKGDDSYKRLSSDATKNLIV